MPEIHPLAAPAAWDAVANGYTSEFLPLFALYAQQAIDLAALPVETHILDVAAGPGTLSLLAARRGHKVSAIDFSENMVAQFNHRVAESNLNNIDVQVADGQALPFADNTFDGAFSMFGLMFFPDRHAGFCELARALKPGGCAVVSSWAPVSEAPLLEALFQCLGSVLPELSFGGDTPPPLANPDDFRQEMGAAGFRSVEIHTVAHAVNIPSVSEFWQSQEKASAPIALLRAKASEDQWRAVSEQVLERLENQFGSGPLTLTWPAHLAIGRTP